MNKTQGWKVVSAASARVKSSVPVKAIYPKKSEYKSAGFIVSRANARQIGINLLVCSNDFSTTGDIVLTAHRKAKRVTVNSYKSAELNS